MSAEFLNELPPKPEQLRPETREFEKNIDKIIEADGKWVPLRTCGGASAKSFQTAIESRANRRRIFVDTDKRVSGGVYTVYGRLVKSGSE